LRDEILELVGRIKVPKADVARAFVPPMTRTFISKWCWGFVVVAAPPPEDNNNNEHDLVHLQQMIGDILYDAPPPDTLYQRQLQEFQQIQSNRKTLRGTRRQIALFPPGKMVHLVKTGEQLGCCSPLLKCVTCCTSNAGFSYTPVWIANDDLDEIVVSPTMGTDHFVDRVCFELEGVAREFGLPLLREEM
jgi:sn1-specific diacylglycerol lipase